MAKDLILVTVFLHSALQNAIQECKHTCFLTQGLDSFLLVQQVDALPLAIHWSFLQEETYTSKVTFSFLTEWMSCLFSMEFSEGKPIRTSHW